MPKIKTKTAHDIRTFLIHDLTISRDTSSGGRQISGYAVMFNQPSKPLPFIEYISPSAFKDVDMTEVQLLYAHDYDNILARVDSGTLSLKVDDKGLFFSAQIPDTTLGNDVYENIGNGNLKGLSFSADIAPGGDNWDTQDDGTVIHTINQFAHLSEISLTSIPAYTETSVQVSRDYKEVLRDMDNNDKTAPTPDQPTNGLSKTEVLEFLQKLLGEKQGNQDSGSDAADTGQPSDDDTQRADNPKKDNDTPTPAPAEKPAANQSAEKPAKPAPAPAANPAPAEKPAEKPAPAANTDSDDSGNEDDDHKQKQPVSRDANPTEKEVNKMDITPKNQDKKNTVVRDFANFLKTGQVADSIRRDTTGVGLSDGSVIIPETILTPEHEQHQFPRLGSLVRTIKVSTTTGKLPVFQTSDDKLSLHTEFTPSQRHAAPEIVPINWDLKTYTGNYAFSQDLISDSSYNWQSELSQRLQELKDNTQDWLIMGQLTNGVNAVKSTDLIKDMKTALNVTLKPQDSAAATIVLSQSAFNELDQMTDKEGRPLVQPDVTKATGKAILGKTAVVVDDLLFPAAKAGDTNVIISPLQKSIINFQNNEITGQFQDSYDIWYKILGIYLREDVVQARKDLITMITTTAATQKAASEPTTPASGK